VSKRKFRNFSAGELPGHASGRSSETGSYGRPPVQEPVALRQHSRTKDQDFAQFYRMLLCGHSDAALRYSMVVFGGVEPLSHTCAGVMASGTLKLNVTQRT
jgi:hypothetical protein